MLKNLFHKSLLFLSITALLLAGYSSNIEPDKLSKCKTETKSKNNPEKDDIVVKALTFEATPSFFQNSFHRFSFVIFSFNFHLGDSKAVFAFFSTFIDEFKAILFTRISPINAP